MTDQAPSGPIPIAIVGVGKIARDQHVPSIAADPHFELVATVTRHHTLDGVPNFATIAEMAAAMPEVRAVSLCTPPRGRLEIVRQAFEQGLDVMLEKPPAATLSEAEAIVAAAAATDRVLYVTWHSRQAAAVEPARAWLAERRVRCVKVTWREDVRRWHPGQEWVWEPGIGVFDPGINALSVLTRLMPGPLLLDRATLRFPCNKRAPIAAHLVMHDEAGVEVDVTFDFDQRGEQVWDIEAETDRGHLQLCEGAGRMKIDGEEIEVPHTPEYARLYARFAQLIATRTSDTDLTPFELVADAALIADRETVEAFSWD